MAFELLGALLEVLAGDEVVCGLVDANICKFLPLEKCEALLKSGNRSMMSCELQDWDGRNSSTEPVFVVDIRSRQGDDRGAEHCSEIVSAVTQLLRDGFGSVQVSKILGTVRYDKTLVGHRCRLAIHGHIPPAISLSLAASPASPQAAGSTIVFVATASPAEGLEYRFLLLGPGTGSVWRDLSGWITRNSFSWRPEAADAGSSTIKVEVRSGKSLPDAVASISYAITAESCNELPVISSLSSSLSSPRGQGTKIEFICQATDADGDPIYYRFLLSGPGTANKKKLVQDWSQRNAWSWQPAREDIGSSTIEVQIRDGQHAGIGSYDDCKSLAFVVSVNSIPEIISLYCNESGTHYVGDKVHIVADASDPDGDKLLFRFWIHRGSVGSVWELLTGWQEKNWILFELDETDYETVSFKVQLRDGKHAGEESYDAEKTLAMSVSRAGLASVTSSLSSPQAHENTIVFTAAANKTAGIYYRFWQKGPGTGNVWRDWTGWQQKNSWSWRTLACDVGSNQVKVQVCDDPDSWNDGDTTGRQTTLNYTVS